MKICEKLHYKNPNLQKAEKAQGGTSSAICWLCFSSSCQGSDSSLLLRPLTAPKPPQPLPSLPTLQVANEVIGEMNLKPEEVFLAQGTLRPDLIESASLVASGKAEVIKTHHNDTELIRKLREEVKDRQGLPQTLHPKTLL